MAIVGEVSKNLTLSSAGKTSSAAPARVAAPQALPFSTTMPATTPAFKLDKGQLQMREVDRALINLEQTYKRLLASVNLKAFKPEKIEDYIQMAEKRTGQALGDDEKARIRELAKSDNPEVLRLLALELRVGIPKKVEKEAMAALGQLMLHRHEREALLQFINHPMKDENLKAYIRTILMMNKVEGWIFRYENMKRRVRKFFQFKYAVPGLLDQKN